MKTIIIEDEEAAASSLGSLVLELYPDTEILCVLQSVEESVEWLGANRMPELIFMDIHLSDDSSFSIFKEVDITCPVIFTTAYDEYALKAFEVNSIDYLLKPIEKGRLHRAIEKYKTLAVAPNDNSALINKLLDDFRQVRSSYKSYFLVAKQDKLTPLAVKDIAYIYTEDKVVTAVTTDRQNYNLDHTMEEIAAMLDPKDFYRANRQYIIARSTIKSASIWFGGKLSLNLTIPVQERVQISKARVKDFKNWLTD